MFETDLHGSAHWATAKEVAQMALLPDPKAKPRSPSRRICYVGGYPDDKGHLRYLQHAGAEHIIAFAPTRSGKGVGLVLPTLLGGWRKSVVVHDIKGENYLLTAGWRRAIGQRVLKFNPGFGLDGDEDIGHQKAQCCHFNPLEEVRIGTPFEVKDVMNIATMIVDPDGKGLNDYWQKTGILPKKCQACCLLFGRFAAAQRKERGLSKPETFDFLGFTHSCSQNRLGWFATQ